MTDRTSEGNVRKVGVEASPARTRPAESDRRMRRPEKPRARWPALLLRWLLAPIGLVLFVLLFAQLGESLRISPSSRAAPWTVPAFAFAAGFFPVLVAVLEVPRAKLPIALILGTCAVLLAMILSADVLGVLGGVLTMIACVAIWIRKAPDPRTIPMIARILAIGLVTTLVLGYARLADRPAFRDELPPALARALGADASAITGFYRYDIDHFFSPDWSLWRIDGSEKVLGQLVVALELEPAPEIPAQFWEMPPAYWPRQPVSGTSGFRDIRRSPGKRDTYDFDRFLVQDPVQSRAFVWFRDLP